jgi:hypothetical protein
MIFPPFSLSRAEKPLASRDLRAGAGRGSIVSSLRSADSANT